MSFALGHNITPDARFSRAANIAAILREDVRQSMIAPAPLAKADTFAAIRARLASGRN
jgi:hypothetical protein